MKNKRKTGYVHPVIRAAFKAVGKMNTYRRLGIFPESSKTPFLLEEPGQLTVAQVEQLALILDRPFMEVANLVRGKKANGEKGNWYDKV